MKKGAYCLPIRRLNFVEISVGLPCLFFYLVVEIVKKTRYKEIPAEKQF
jgi:hypothetical protein